MSLSSPITATVEPQTNRHVGFSTSPIDRVLLPGSHVPGYRVGYVVALSKPTIAMTTAQVSSLCSGETGLSPFELGTFLLLCAVTSFPRNAAQIERSGT